MAKPPCAKSKPPFVAGERQLGSVRFVCIEPQTAAVGILDDEQPPDEARQYRRMLEAERVKMRAPRLQVLAAAHGQGDGIEPFLRLRGACIGSKLQNGTQPVDLQGDREQLAVGPAMIQMRLPASAKAVLVKGQASHQVRDRELEMMDAQNDGLIHDFTLRAE